MRVFADDVGIVTAGFIHIVAVKIHFIGKIAPFNAPNVPNASAENRILSTVSYVTITSGQCTMGAAMKVRLCLPVESVSPSLTMSARGVMSRLKTALSCLRSFCCRQQWFRGSGAEAPQALRNGRVPYAE